MPTIDYNKEKKILKLIYRVVEQHIELVEILNNKENKILELIERVVEQHIELVEILNNERIDKIDLYDIKNLKIDISNLKETE